MCLKSENSIKEIYPEKIRGERLKMAFELCRVVEALLNPEDVLLENLGIATYIELDKDKMIETVTIRFSRKV